MLATKRYEDQLQDELKKHLDFLYTVIDAVNDTDQAEFECPICGATAYASKSTVDGHVHAYCYKCRANFMQ